MQASPTVGDIVERLAGLYYCRVPKRLLRLLNPFVEPIYALGRRLYEVLLDVFPPDGVLRDGSDPEHAGLRVAGRGEVCEILVQRVCTTEQHVERRARRAIWRVSRRSRDGREAAALIEADRCFNRLLSRRGYVAVPEWVLFTMDVSAPWSAMVSEWKQRLPDNLRRLRKNRYGWRLTHDAAELRSFYKRMYLPYIVSRYGDRALLASLAYMETVLLKGALLLVTDGGNVVAGVLLSTAATRPLVAFMGVMDADFEHVKRGAVSALYYFTMRWAKESGYQTIDFGHSRPFPDNGLLRYKQRWGMVARPSPRKPRTLFVRAADADPRVAAFLRRPVFVYDRKGALVPFRAAEVGVAGREQTSPSASVWRGSGREDRVAMAKHA